MTVEEQLARRTAEAAAARPAPSAALVSALSTTPVKGLHVAARSELRLEHHGVTDNRRFFLIDADARMVNGKQIGTLAAVHAGYDPDERVLTLTFPDGSVATGAVTLGEPIETRFFSRMAPARLVLGPWSAALSAFAGRPLRLVEAGAAHGGVDRGASGTVSLISRASLEHLARLAGEPVVDGRRFRMLIEVEGPSAHEEDEWVGRQLRVGAALVAIRGHVGRCVVTTLSPDSGTPDLPTLDLLRSYRLGLQTTEPLAFGVYGEVLEPAIVRLGDAVAPR
jgi:uncharacterized protein